MLANFRAARKFSVETLRANAGHDGPSKGLMASFAPINQATAEFRHFLLDPPRRPLLHFLTRIISEMSVLRRAQEARLSNLDAPLEPEPQARQRAPDQFFAENSKGDE
jgi:hypothetical protein